MKPPITDALALALTDNVRLRAEVERLQYENAALRRDIRYRDRLRVADLLTAAHRGAKLPEDHTSGSGEARGEKG